VQEYEGLLWGLLKALMGFPLMRCREGSVGSIQHGRLRVGGRVAYASTQGGHLLSSKTRAPPTYFTV
jgi:hypothetical protein